MITELSKKQIEIMEQTRKDWMDKLFNPKPLIIDQAVEGVRWLYKMSGRESPMIFIGSSPMSIQYIINQQTETDSPKTAKNKILNAIKFKDLGDDVYLMENDAISDINSLSGLKYESTSNYGNITDYSWLAFYDFFSRINFQITNEHYESYKKMILSNIYDMIQLDGAVIISTMPKNVHVDDDYRLHADESPAIEWDDGYKLYYIHGMVMPSEYIETKAEDMDVNLVVHEDNAERRHFLVSKIGIDRIVKELKGKVIDTIDGISLYENNKIGNYYQHGDVIIKPTDTVKEFPFTRLSSDMRERLKTIKYELIDLELGDKRYRPYLVMNNPSVDHLHVEAVHDSCHNVVEAIHWRNQINYLPCNLT